jgi:hypothetical protein
MAPAFSVEGDGEAQDRERDQRRASAEQRQNEGAAHLCGLLRGADLRGGQRGEDGAKNAVVHQRCRAQFQQ